MAVCGPAAILRCDFRHGEVAEWLKAHAWKACIRETVSWVRIPPSPPGSYTDLFSAPRSLRKKRLLLALSYTDLWTPIARREPELFSLWPLFSDGDFCFGAVFVFGRHRHREFFVGRCRDDKLLLIAQRAAYAFRSQVAIEGRGAGARGLHARRQRHSLSSDAVGADADF